MVCTRTGRVLGVEPMKNPENNEIKIKSLSRILQQHPNCNIACQFQKKAKYNPANRNYIVDKWRGKKH